MREAALFFFFFFQCQPQTERWPGGRGALLSKAHSHLGASGGCAIAWPGVGVG